MINRPARCVVLLLVASVVACARPAEEIEREPDPATRRVLDQGELVGTRGRDYTLAWYGIPFAASPVGELRWRAPRPHAGWTGELQATDFSVRCTQLSSELDTGVEPGVLVGAEDCLYLNVWAPAGVVAAADKLPVMVWIHGGANSWGFAGQHEMGRLAATQNVVVVSVNYRLGPFGWFAHDSIRATADDEIDRSSNFGTLDLIQALDWVASNITEFGGDADNITVFGESAGAVNVGTLLVSPLARGKFHKAISQSGIFAVHSLQEAEYGLAEPAPSRGFSSSEAVAKLAVLAGRDSADDTLIEQAAWLRSLSAEDLMAGYLALAHEPGAAPPGMLGIETIDVTADNIVIPEQGIEALFATAGAVADVPVILGTNRDELLAIGLTNDDVSGHVWILYFWPKDPELYQAYGGYASRLWRAFGADEPADKLIAAGNTSVYTYRFDWDEQGMALFTNVSEIAGAAHALEVGFISGGFEDHVNDPMGIYFTEDNRAGREALSQAMMSYWAEFAYNGSPGKGRGGDLPEWLPRTEGTGPTTMLLDSDNDEGLRMTSERLTVNGVLADIARDPRLKTDRERCMVVQMLQTVAKQYWQQLQPLEAQYCLQPDANS